MEERLKQRARDLGFALVGIAEAGPADGFDRLADWLERGFAGEMAYLSRTVEERRHPKSVLPEVRSVVMLGMNHAQSGEEAPAGAGRVARYARGPDYHRVLWDRVNALVAWAESEVPGCVGRGVADTAPLLERDFARRAGLGWFGKNTLLLNKQRGSYVLLAAVLLSAALRPDAPHLAAHCGTCTACLDACPTAAFPEPGVLDARRCVSYLTIELRGPIPEELRAGVGDWLFGCDVCQEVCPWNRKAPATGEAGLGQGPATLDPVELLQLTEEEYRRRFRDTALWRARRRGLLRNAAIVLGNHGDPRARAALERALGDREAVVREAAAWAIGRLHRG